MASELSVLFAAHPTQRALLSAWGVQMPDSSRQWAEHRPRSYNTLAFS